MKERALAHVAVVINDRTKVPSEEAFADAQRLYQIESSFEGPYVSAQVYGAAARNNKNFEAAALRFLSEAIRRGLPKGTVEKLPRAVSWLYPKLEEELVASAKEGFLPARTVASALQHPAETANWTRFLNTVAPEKRLLASSE